MVAQLTSVEKNQEILSLALEDRSSGYEDLVSNSNALLAMIKAQGGWLPFHGPTIRERLLYNESGNVQWYNGYDPMANSPAELFNDAEWRPKMCAVGISLSNEEILLNSGSAQLMDVMSAHIDAAEQELQDEVDTSLHSDGTRFGGKELSGLKLAVPTTTNTGTYGGINRATATSWQTTTYDANSQTIGGASITAVSSTTIRLLLNKIMTERSRGKRGPDLLLMSSNHYGAYDAATVAIQRINDENMLGKLGFQTLKFFGAGKSAIIVQDGGIGSNMPQDVTYCLESKSFHFRYHPERNFSKIGKTMMPINQDAAVQYIGVMGELTMFNPLFNAKLYDSSP